MLFFCNVDSEVICITQLDDLNNYICSQKMKYTSAFADMGDAFA